MSLINEALKKAQRQRSLDSAPLSSAPSGVAAAAVSTHVSAASHLRRRTTFPVWFGVALLFLGAGVTGLIMHFGRGPSVAPASPPAVVPSPGPAPVAVTPMPSPAAPPQTLIAAQPPAAPAPIPEASVLPLPTVNRPLPPAPVPAPPVPVSPVAATPSRAEQEARVFEFLNSARITGVRGVGAQARVLMNERVYRLNDIVEADLGLRLSAVRAGLMVFTDRTGKTYEKPY